MRSNGAETIHPYTIDYRLRRLAHVIGYFDYRAGDNISSATQGYLVDWDAQKAVWDGIFSNEVIGVCLSFSRGHQFRFEHRILRSTRANPRSSSRNHISIYRIFKMYMINSYSKNMSSNRTIVVHVSNTVFMT